MNKQMSSALAIGDRTEVVLKVEGTQEFMGKEIPIIEGGFGEGQKAVLAKTVALIHEVRVNDIQDLINNNIDEFEVGIDIVDMKGNEEFETVAVGNGIYSQNAINRSSNIYLLSEQGYMALVGLMKTEKAKALRKKFRREYFTMREVVKNDPYAGVSLEMKSILLLDKRSQEQESRINKLENNIHITRSQQKQLKQFANKIIVSALGSRLSNAYKMFSGRVFSAFWHDYYNHFNVSSYLDTPKLNFQDALKFVNDWEPNEEIRCMIKGANIGGQYNV